MTTQVDPRWQSTLAASWELIKKNFEESIERKVPGDDVIRLVKCNAVALRIMSDICERVASGDDLDELEEELKDILETETKELFQYIEAD